MIICSYLTRQGLKCRGQQCIKDIQCPINHVLHTIIHASSNKLALDIASCISLATNCVSLNKSTKIIVFANQHQPYLGLITHINLLLSACQLICVLNIKLRDIMNRLEIIITITTLGPQWFRQWLASCRVSMLPYRLDHTADIRTNLRNSDNRGRTKMPPAKCGDIRFNHNEFISLPISFLTLVSMGYCATGTIDHDKKIRAKNVAK